ncbi:zinc ABC transporter substrate-binding protein [Anaerobacillus sp. CMMVII]|uniref:metal ABC transporter solute-binding protein, Zn/Mn family n=1 Tax=Anaerobacillus sp. CMMVII TaxID=2755588 RepID=UPI0021B799D6|nr:zinc ABC transporter substrate-binding protein [Anaerobacillus sp. CMMVII]MCT8138726.1 zinc ABC transporter substrate-binding protein [Anaerobacillus sp. CMMVII]
MKFRSISFAIILVLTTFLSACGAKEEEPTDHTLVDPDVADEMQVLQVYTTIFPLMDFTQKIGGEYVDVKSIIPLGADAHTFEPSPKTMVDVSNAHLYIYNGAGIEGFADAAAEVLKSGNVKILMASENVDLLKFDEHNHDHDDHGHDDHGHDHDDHGHEDDAHDHDDHGHDHDDHGHEDDGHDHDDHGHDDHGDDHDEDHSDDDHNHQHGEEDPHIWLDPIRSIQIAENIKNALVELLPEASEDFESNFLSLKEQLEALDGEFKKMVEEVSKDTIVVSHAGYGYWTERYGIKQVGISGISPTNEPSIRQITKVIEFVEHNEINFIIFEQNIPMNIAETVRSQVGAEVLWLHNLEALTEEDVENGADYFSLMANNIETLRTALR